MIIYACAEVTPGSKLNLMLTFPNGTPLLESLFSTATSLFQRARHELCSAAADARPNAAADVSPNTRRVAACQFAIDEAVVYAPATCTWSVLCSEEQLYNNVQLYLFQPADEVADVGINDKVGQMPDPVKPQVFFSEFIDAPSPSRVALQPASDATDARDIRTMLSLEQPAQTDAVHTVASSTIASPPASASSRRVAKPVPPSSCNRTSPARDVSSPSALKPEASRDLKMSPPASSAAPAATRDRRPSPPLRRSSSLTRRPSSPSILVRSQSTASVAAPVSSPDAVTAELFALLDTDNDGTVTLFQLHDAMSRLKMDVSPKAVGKTFAYGDRAVSRAVFGNFVGRYWSVSVELLERLRSERATECVSSPLGSTTSGAGGEQREQWGQQLQDVLDQERDLMAKLQAVRKVKGVLLNALERCAGNGKPCDAAAAPLTHARSAGF